MTGAVTERGDSEIAHADNSPAIRQSGGEWPPGKIDLLRRKLTQARAKALISLNDFGVLGDSRAGGPHRIASAGVSADDAGVSKQMPSDCQAGGSHGIASAGPSAGYSETEKKPTQAFLELFAGSGLPSKIVAEQSTVMEPMDTLYRLHAEFLFRETEGGSQLAALGYATRSLRCRNARLPQRPG